MNTISYPVSAMESMDPLESMELDEEGLDFEFAAMAGPYGVQEENDWSWSNFH